GDRDAGFADAARVDGRPAMAVRTDAVERLGDQPRRGCLADAAHPGEQKGMGQPPALDRIGERLHHSILPNQLVEALRAIFAGEDSVVLAGYRLRWLVETTAGSIVGRFGHHTNLTTDRRLVEGPGSAATL